MSEHDDSFPLREAKSTTPDLENYTSNYLKSCIMNRLMPVITCAIFKSIKKTFSHIAEQNINCRRREG